MDEHDVPAVGLRSVGESAGSVMAIGPPGNRAGTFYLVAALCIGSGGAALIYQVVWFQLLSLVIGASSVSLGVVLGTFMGGMCIGSLALWRVISARRHPLRVLACIELGIGLCGLLVYVAVPALNGLYAELASGDTSGMTGLVLRATVAAVCLLPPTMLMGATLPAVARWLEATPKGIARMGLCYGSNLFGAVAGSLLAGFYLLPHHDVAFATWAAVAINALVALLALALAARTPGPAPEATASYGVEATARLLSTDDERRREVRTARRTQEAAAWPVYTATALSGFTALSAEVIWTRHLSLLLGATVYTFALVLAVFLLGLGLGSSLGATASHRIDARVALGCCQLLLAVAMAWAAYTIAAFLPYWPLDVGLDTPLPVALQLDLLRVLWAVLPAALAWGASFPLALAAAARAEDPARLMGGLYAANTIGAIVGALATSFVLISTIGSQATQQLLVLAAVCAALLVLGPARSSGLALRGRRLAAVAAAGVVALGATLAIPPLPGALVAYGRFLPTRSPGSTIVYTGEGLTASIAVSRQANGTLTYHNAGKAQASTYPQDMRLQRMLGHLTTLVPESGRSYLVIGLGAGITAGAVAIDPNAERVVVAEIEPLASEAADKYFRAQNHGLIGNPKVDLRIDDGRHFLLTTNEQFDGITSDPLDPWVKGAAALYTREFWALARSRLKPGGVVTVFVQLYETTEDAVKSELATFFEVFPHGAVFANTVQGRGYDAVLLARADDAPIDLDRIDALLGLPEYGRVARSLTDVGFFGAADLFGTYAGRAADLSSWLEDAVITTDRNLRLQYLAGRGLNLNLADAIYGNLSAAGATPPQGYFHASPELMKELEATVRARYGEF